MADDEIPLPTIPTAPLWDMGYAVGLDANGEARLHSMVPYVERRLRGVPEVTGATYTCVLSDAGKLITHTHATACEFILPRSSSVVFQYGSVIRVMQGGVGRVRIGGEIGVEIAATPAGRRRTRAQWSVAEAMLVGPDKWVVTGDVAV